MNRQTEPKKKPSGFSVIMSLALLFVAVFMVFSAVSQFRAGRIVSGCVSVLGAVLFFGLIGLQVSALIRQKRAKKKEQQEDDHGTL